MNKPAFDQQRQQYFDADSNTVYIHSNGDYWVNQEQTAYYLEQIDLGRTVNIDMLWQAISLTQSGLHGLLEQWRQRHHLEKHQIHLVNNPNQLENYLGYVNDYQYPVCDEFLRCTGYWQTCATKKNLGSKKFCMSVGRRTTPRMKMLYDISNFNPDCFFVTALNTDENGYWENDLYYNDRLSLWVDNLQEQQQFIEWARTCRIVSADNKNINDQYDPTECARTSMIKLSANWDIELVFESLTVGETFAPTEKIIKPIIAGRPFLVYASNRYLDNLKALGFRTFDTLWSESYDRYELRDRYDHIWQTVKSVCLMDHDEYAHMIKQADAICNHNRQILYNILANYYQNDKFWINNANEELT